MVCEYLITNSYCNFGECGICIFIGKKQKAWDSASFPTGLILLKFLSFSGWKWLKLWFKIEFYNISLNVSKNLTQWTRWKKKTSFWLLNCRNKLDVNLRTQVFSVKKFVFFFFSEKGSETNFPRSSKNSTSEIKKWGYPLGVTRITHERLFFEHSMEVPSMA